MLGELVVIAGSDEDPGLLICATFVGDALGIWAGDVEAGGSAGLEGLVIGCVCDRLLLASFTDKSLAPGRSAL